MENYTKVILNKGKEKSLLRKHPWIFSGALKTDLKQLKENEIVDVFDDKGQYLATGYVQYGSIAIRVLSFEKTEINQEFWDKTISNAYKVRKDLGIANQEHTNCYRLMHGEGDSVPGLIVDFYAGVCVIQCHTSGIHQFVNQIKEALLSQLEGLCKGVYDKSAESLHQKIEESNNGWLTDIFNHDVVKENNHVFKIDWIKGQKTGFFIDQRENRELLGKYSKGKSVLNTFAYTGGFSIYALNNGASKVVSVDVSKQAIAILEENVKLNQNQQNHTSFAIDTFQYFKENNELFDIVILDPPAFAKSINARHNALKGYKRLNIEGMKKVKKGGLLFTFSCSQVVDSTMFYQAIMSAAIETGIQFKVIHRLTQPPDHPVNIYHTEGEYLKGLVLYRE